MQKVITPEGKVVFKFSLTEEIQKNQQLEFKNVMLFEQLRGLQEKYHKEVVLGNKSNCWLCKLKRFIRRL